MSRGTAIFFLLMVLLVAPTSAELQCGELLKFFNTSYPDTTLYGQKYAAQAFRVDLTTHIFNLTLGGTLTITIVTMAR